MRAREPASFGRENVVAVGRDPFNSDRSELEKWSTSKSGPVFSKHFRLDRTDPLSFGLKFPEILVEWISPVVYLLRVSRGCRGGGNKFSWV